MSETTNSSTNSPSHQSTVDSSCNNSDGHRSVNPGLTQAEDNPSASASYGAELVISSHPTNTESSRPVSNVTVSHAMPASTPHRTTSMSGVDNNVHVAHGSPVGDSGLREPAARDDMGAMKDSSVVQSSPEQREINRQHMHQQIHQHLHNWHQQNANAESQPTAQVS